MGKIYFLYSTYKPNTAATNRLLAFLNAFSQLSIEVEVVFTLSDSENSRVQDNIPNIKFTYLWDRLNVKNRYLRQVAYIILSHRFARRVKSGDKVVIFDPQKIMFRLIKKQGVEVYSERTEHPFVFPIRTINMKRYVKKSVKLDGLFVISTALKQYYVDLGVPEDKVHIVNMIVNSSRFQGINKDLNVEPYIAYCGNASNNKDGVDRLIRAFNIFSKDHPEFKLYIIGKALSTADTSGNRQLVMDLGLTDKILFTGIIDAEDIPKLLVNAKALVLDRPDNIQAQYGFPTKLGEYLSTKNPVVVTNVGDISVFLKDGESAFIAEPDDEISFACKLAQAMDDIEKSKEIGYNGYLVAQRNFNSLIEAKKIADVLGLKRD